MSHAETAEMRTYESFADAALAGELLSRADAKAVLTAPDAVDGAAFVTDGGTDIRDATRVGDRVELRARIVPDGRLMAERLHAR